MKVLWITNVPLPEASKLLNEPSTPFGGWLSNMAEDIANQGNIELSIAFPHSKGDTIHSLEGAKINYYPFPHMNKNNQKNVQVFMRILSVVLPDIVHIYGTELAHTAAIVNACTSLDIKKVISIQGLVSIISQHTYANLPPSVIYNMSIRNMLKRDSVHGLKKLYESRGKYEIDSLKETNHVIGRTAWDYACTHQINPKIEYHFCNETLREEFYNHQWDIDLCEKHSVFLSQGSYSVKGLHFMIAALPIVLREYPDTKVYIGGKDITKTKTLKDRLLMSYYGIYIKKMIRKFNLESKIIFTGSLDEKQMCQQFLKAHVFVSSSSIENSSNSLGEAMILGVPSISSYVGGIPNLITHEKEGFVYQADAPYMLAYYICEIFKDNELALTFSANARERALVTHNKKNNTNTLVGIYNKIIGES